MTTDSGAPSNGATPNAKAPKLKINVEHQVPGRIRMKVKAAKGDPELLQQIGDAFSVIPGIDRVTVNPLTGSVVLHYDAEDHSSVTSALDRRVRQGPQPPPTEIDVLASKIASEARYLAQHSHTARAVVDFFSAVDLEIKDASGNTVDLNIVFALAVIGVTVFEIGATTATPIWLTLAVFTVNHFIEMRHPYEPVPVPARAPVLVKSG
jgi:Heavy metal associated domain 2